MTIITKKTLNEALAETYSNTLPRLKDDLTESFIKHSFSKFKEAVLYVFEQNDKEIDNLFFNSLDTYICETTYCHYNDEAKEVFSRFKLDILDVIEFSNYLIDFDTREIKARDLLEHLYDRVLCQFFSELEDIIKNYL